MNKKDNHYIGFARWFSCYVALRIFTDKTCRAKTGVNMDTQFGIPNLKIIFVIINDLMADKVGIVYFESTWHEVTFSSGGIKLFT